jgi:protein gp37
MGQINYRNGFEVTLHPHMLVHPLRWRQPRRVFVNSMSDLFHEEVPAEYISRVFDVMHRAAWHNYQVLTKRSARLLELDPVLQWAPHIWLGVSVESDEYLERIAHLRRTHAHVKFLSLEPLLSALTKLNLQGIDWVIAGGESGPNARPINEEWVREIRDRCIREGVAFFFKQWGGVRKSRTGRVLDGRTWDDMPVRSDSRRSDRLVVLAS